MGAAHKVAIITGGSQGIGEALVRAFRDRNFCVVANSRSIRPSSDPDILAVAGDITDPNTAERIVSLALERFGRVDTLVNNAGIFIAKPFTEYTDEDYANLLGINLDGFFHVTRRAEGDSEAGLREVGMVFQSFNLFPHLTVLENCTLAPMLVRGVARAEAEAQARAYLERVRIPDQAGKFPGQLWGGQQQRVAIARALCMKPKIMLFR
nr:SDR family NAD(P)-dependent oxidoreductase [Bradyrhizobium sp. Cp5.3]